MEFPPRPDFEGDSDLSSFSSPEVESEPELVEDEGFASFGPRVTEDVQGLIFLGQLSHSFEYAGHHFTIKTLRSGEELIVAQIIQEYVDNGLAINKAFGIGHVAAALMSVDHRPFIEAIGPGRQNRENQIRAAFNTIADPNEGWFWAVVEVIYAEYADLIVRQAVALGALESKSLASRLTS